VCAVDGGAASRSPRPVAHHAPARRAVAHGGPTHRAGLARSGRRRRVARRRGAQARGLSRSGFKSGEIPAESRRARRPRRTRRCRRARVAPTLSRLVPELASTENRAVVREALLETAARRVKAGRDGHRMRYASIDVDGHQPTHEKPMRTPVGRPRPARASGARAGRFSSWWERTLSPRGRGRDLDVSREGLVGLYDKQIAGEQAQVAGPAGPQERQTC
jgi:hypothetical protein